jgi:cell division protein FtsB
LAQLKKDVATIRSSITHQEGKIQDMSDKVTTLKGEVDDLRDTQKNCCQVLNEKLDQIINVLIPPPPLPAVGFVVTAEIVG